MLWLAGRPEAKKNILTKENSRNDSSADLPQQGKKPIPVGKVGGRDMSCLVCLHFCSQKQGEEGRMPDPLMDLELSVLTWAAVHGDAGRRSHWQPTEVPTGPRASLETVSSSTLNEGKVLLRVNSRGQIWTCNCQPTVLLSLQGLGEVLIDGGFGWFCSLETHLLIVV